MKSSLTRQHDRTPCQRHCHDFFLRSCSSASYMTGQAAWRGVCVCVLPEALLQHSLASSKFAEAVHRVGVERRKHRGARAVLDDAGHLASHRLLKLSCPSSGSSSHPDLSYLHSAPALLVHKGQIWYLWRPHLKLVTAKTSWLAACCRQSTDLDRQKCARYSAVRICPRATRAQAWPRSAAAKCGSTLRPQQLNPLPAATIKSENALISVAAADRTRYSCRRASNRRLCSTGCFLPPLRRLNPL